MVKYFLTLMLLLACGGVGNAALVVQFGGATITGAANIAGPVAAGDSVVIPVLVFDDNTGVAGPVTINNATITVDLGGFFAAPPNTGLDLGPFENFGVTNGSVAGFSATFTDAVSPVLGYDRNVQGSGTSFAISSDAMNPDTLFNLTFDVAAGTAAGTYFVGQNGPLVLNSFSSGAGIPIAQSVSFTNGGVEVTAVPEPSSVLALLGVAGVVGFRRRRQRTRLDAKLV